VRLLVGILLVCEAGLQEYPAAKFYTNVGSPFITVKSNSVEE